MSSLPKSSSMLTDAFGTLVVRAIGIVLMFASTALTARLLGPEEYGTYTAALSLALLMAALAPLGSDRILVRNLSNTKCPIQTGREIAIAHLCTAIVATLLLSGSLAACVVSGFIFDNQKCARTTLLAAVMFIPLTVTYLRQWLAIPIIGSRRAVIPEQTILPFIFTMSLLLMAAAGWKLSAATAVATNATVMGMVWIGSLQVGPIGTVYRSAWNAIPNAGRSEISRQFKEGVPFVGVGIGSLLTQSCMPLVIAAICGFKEAAYFALAFPFAVLIALPQGAFNLSLIPRCARHYGQGEFEDANHLVRRAATITTLIAAALSMVIWTCSPLLTPLFGTDYRMVCTLLPPLLLAVIVDCLTGPTIPVMQTMKMENTYSLALLAFVPIQFSIVYWFGKVADIEGTVMAYLTSRCLWNLIVFITIYHQRGLVMFPYLSVRLALDESHSAFNTAAGYRRPQQCHWTNASSPNVPDSPARAA